MNAHIFGFCSHTAHVRSQCTMHTHICTMHIRNGSHHFIVISIHFIYLFFPVFILKYELIDTFHTSIFSHSFSSLSLSHTLTLYRSPTLRMCVSRPVYDQQELVIILKSIPSGGKSFQFGGKNETIHTHTHTRKCTHHKQLKNSRQSAKW